MSLVYNLNDNAVQVLAGKKIKENIFMDLFHKNGKGVTEQTGTDCASVRIFKMNAFNTSARKLGAQTNGGFFNNDAVTVPQVIEYDLPLLYVYDSMVDLPEVQQDLVAVNTFEESLKNIGGRVATEINASTLATQLAKKFSGIASMTTPAFNDKAVIIGTGTTKCYDALMEAHTLLDDGDDANGIQAYPFEDREVLMRSGFYKELMSTKGVILGGSNYAQSMLAKGAVDPESKKEFGNMYVGEINLVPCYLCPKPIWNRTKEWLTYTVPTGKTDIVEDVEAVVMSALGTDRGISTPEYVKAIDCPNGAGKRLQPKTRWGVEVCYDSAIVPILKNGTTVASVPSTITISAPGNVATQA